MIAFVTPMQKNSTEFTNDVNAKLHYQKLEADILAKEQAATAVATQEAHNRYMLAQYCLREVDIQGGGLSKGNVQSRNIDKASQYTLG